MAKQMKANDTRLKTVDELKTILLDLRKAQFNLRFQRASGQILECNLDSIIHGFHGERDNTHQ